MTSSMQTPRISRSPSLMPTVAAPKPVSDAIWETYIELGDNAYRKGFFDMAEKMFLAAIKEASHRLPEPACLGTILCHFGKFYFDQDRHKKAEVFLKRSIDTFDRDKKSYDPCACDAIELLARVSVTEGRYDQAEKLFKRQFAIVKKIYGRHDPRLIEPIRSLIQLYRTYGKFERADALALRLRKLQLDMKAS
jgi:tetratricopeptide (TPR) repeat protein